MEKAKKVRSFPKVKKDWLDEMIEKGETDEMGLLDLIYLEEMVKQNKQEKTG